MYLKPKDDTVLLRDPRSNVALPLWGANVPESSWWIRRKLDGDALPTTAEAVARGAAAARSAASGGPAEKTIVEVARETIAPDDEAPVKPKSRTKKEK